MVVPDEDRERADAVQLLRQRSFAEEAYGFAIAKLWRTSMMPPDPPHLDGSSPSRGPAHRVALESPPKGSGAMCMNTNDAPAPCFFE